MRYSVVVDPEVVDEVLNGLSPFNLSNDIKNIKKEVHRFSLEDIAEEVANEIMCGPHGKTYCIIYVCKQDHNINYSKIRTDDFERKKGKSNGYRVIVLIDHNSKYAFILHIYRHGTGPDNLSNKERNALEQVVEEYSNSLNAN